MLILFGERMLSLCLCWHVTNWMRLLLLLCGSDGRERAAHCNKRKQLKAIRRNASANQHSDLNQPLIPVS